MDFSTLQTTRTERNDWFLAGLFTPAPTREALYTLYALDVELAHVHHAVSEEMLGHIRYAWWQEHIEGAPAPGHPLFTAIEAHHVPADLLVPLVAHYREHFPDPPPHAAAFAQHAARTLIEQRSPRALKKWEKATATITAHRTRHGQRWRSWLLVKLLFV